MSSAVLISGSLVGARELIAELGADPGALALEANLPARLFDEPDIFVQADRIADFLELAAVACRCPEFGLLHARRLPLGILGQGWMIMRAAETVGDALNDFARIYGLYTDAGSLRAERCRDGVWMEYSFLPVGRYGVTQIIHLTLGRVCLFVTENLTHRWHPRQVLLRQTPADIRPFVEFFGPGVKFGQARDAVLIDHETLAERMGEGAGRRQVHRAMLNQIAGHGPAVVAQVKSLLSALLRHDHCSIEAIGSALGISPRTLQRRLVAAGISYRRLVDEVRADLAWRHVKRTDLSLGLVAGLLGYDSQAAFSRAFLRWHGMSPRIARRLQVEFPASSMPQPS